MGDRHHAAEYQLREMHAADHRVHGRARPEFGWRFFLSPLRGAANHGRSLEADRPGMACREVISVLKNEKGRLPAALFVLGLRKRNVGRPELRAVDVLSLEPLRTPFYLELHFRALLQRPVTGHLDCREVNKHILAAGPLDKSIALGGVKPFDDTLFSHYLISPLSPRQGRDRA